MNILLLIVDTLRYDRVAFHGACPHIRTPNFDRLAAKSLVFDRTFASSYPTIPHRTDLITGRTGSPFHPWAPLAFNQPTLPRLLAERGYCTQLIHDTPHLVNGGHAFDYPFHAWTFIRGAEVDRPIIDDQPLTMLPNWCHDPSLPLPERAADELNHRMIVTYTRANRNRTRPEDWNAAKVFLAAIDFLRRNARRDNFFLWLDCFDPHEPWDAPPEFVARYDATPGYDGRIDPRLFTEAARHDGDTRLPEAIVRRQTALYDAKVSWVDHWFGKLLDALGETGLDRNTAVVLTADHGTNLYDRGRFGKSGPPHEQEAHVPLLVRIPDGPTGRRDSIVQPQDISATLLEMAGASVPAGWAGTSLLKSGKGKRAMGLCGAALSGWPKVRDWPAFCALDQHRFLLVSPDPQYDRLYEYVSKEDIAATHGKDATRMRCAALDELAHRGAPDEVVKWYRSGGSSRVPAAIGRSLTPEGWKQYFGQLWERWD
jgi:arylsulfatase A-like enzyme